jgi:hypothetical protein
MLKHLIIFLALLSIPCISAGQDWAFVDEDQVGIKHYIYEKLLSSEGNSILFWYKYVTEDFGVSKTRCAINCERFTYTVAVDTSTDINQDDWIWAFIEPETFWEFLSDGLCKNGKPANIDDIENFLNKIQLH